MNLKNKILLSLHPFLLIITVVLFISGYIYPIREFNWYQILNLLLNICGVLNLIYLTFFLWRKLSFKKGINIIWTILLVSWYPISSLIFIWKIVPTKNEAK